MRIMYVSGSEIHVHNDYITACLAGWLSAEAAAADP
jgi:hypothetical protein